MTLIHRDAFVAQFIREWLHPWDADTEGVQILIDTPSLLATSSLERLRGPVLVLTENACPHYLHWLSDAGWSVLVSPRDPNEVVQAANCVLAGGTVYRGPDLNSVSALFPRERAVLYAIALGLDNAEIASWLGVSVKTVANVACEVLDKLGLKNRVEAALYFRGELADGPLYSPLSAASVRPRYASTRPTREVAISFS